MGKFAIIGFITILTVFAVTELFQENANSVVSMFFPDPGLMGQSTQERQYLRNRRGQDFRTVQNEFSVRRSDLYGHPQRARLSQKRDTKRSAALIQSLALAKSEPSSVQLPVVHMKPDPIVSMAIQDMEKVHARRYSAQVIYSHFSNCCSECNMISRSYIVIWYRRHAHMLEILRERSAVKGSENANNSESSRNHTNRR